MTTPRSFANRLIAYSIPAIASISISFMLGCSGRNPVRPLGSGGVDLAVGHSAGAAGFGSGTFYPLSVGNAWDYAGGGNVYFIENGSPVPYFAWTFTESDRLVGTVLRNGATYFVREEVTRQIPDDGYGPVTWWTRLRQDAGGLYFADTLLFDPAVGTETRVASSTRPGLRLDFAPASSSERTTIALARLADRLEFLRGVVRGVAGFSATPGAIDLLELSYPLRIGATWDIRPDIPWPATVEKVEILDTPAGPMNAYRIGINPGGNTVHEGEWARVWYSREGYLGYSIHLFSQGTDENGDPTGVTYVTDDSMRVTSLSVSR